MGIGLAMAFYLFHQRFWAVAIHTNSGPGLWIGTAADKNREHFQESFTALVDGVRNRLGKENVPQDVPVSKSLVQV